MSDINDDPDTELDHSAVVMGLHSRARRLIELRMEHAELNVQIDTLCASPGFDQLLLGRLKKKRLALKDLISRFEDETEPPELA
jgi:hypothetical protein